MFKIEALVCPCVSDAENKRFFFILTQLSAREASPAEQLADASDALHLRAADAARLPQPFQELNRQPLADRGHLRGVVQPPRPRPVVQPGANVIKLFYGRYLRIFVISYSVCHWEVCPA